MMRITEHSTGSLPEAIKPVWLDAFGFTESLLNDAIPKDESIDSKFIPGHQRGVQRFLSSQLLGTPSPEPARKNRRLSDNIFTILSKLRDTAKDHRIKGRWKECIDAMERYIDVETCVYDLHQQEVISSIVNYLLTVLNYSTLLAEKGMQHKSFELLSSAESKLKDVKDSRLKYLLKALMYNSVSNYYFKKKKYNACCTFAKDALKYWKKIGSIDYTFYFTVKYATAASLSGRYNEAYEQYNLVLMFADQDGLRGRGTPLPIDVSFKIPSIENEKLYFDECVILMALHNMGVTQCALRRYSHGFATVERCMQFCKNYGLTVGHSWLKQFHKTYEFALMQSQHPTFEQFRMKIDETHQKDMLNVSKKVEKYVERRGTPLLRPLKSAPTTSFSSSLNSPRQEVMDATVKSLPQIENPKQKKLLLLFPFLKNEIFDIELNDDTLLPDAKVLPIKPSSSWSEDTERRTPKLPPMKPQTKPKSQPASTVKRKKLSPIKNKREKRPKSVLLVDEQTIQALTRVQCIARRFLATKLIRKMKTAFENRLEKDLIREQLEYEPLSVRSEDSYESEADMHFAEKIDYNLQSRNAILKIQLFFRHVISYRAVKRKKYIVEQDLLHEEAICTDEYEPPTPDEPSFSFEEENFEENFDDVQ